MRPFSRAAVAALGVALVWLTSTAFTSPLAQSPLQQLESRQGFQPRLAASEGSGSFAGQSSTFSSAVAFPGCAIGLATLVTLFGKWSNKHRQRWRKAVNSENRGRQGYKADRRPPLFGPEKPPHEKKKMYHYYCNKIWDINFTGFCRVQMPFNALQELAVAMERLQQNGFPPVFVFVFDQLWQMLHELFQPVATLLGKSPDEMHMSLSVFAWALQCGVSEQAGSNFGRAHRDKSYDDSHTDGRVGMLTTWIPLTPVGPEDGCMHVVPSAFDELFNSSDPKHLRPETPETHGEALSCKAGEVLIWKANLIHWGASCTSTRPRRSMATAFVTEDVKAFKALASVMRHELPEDLETRLRIIVKSLLQYKSWYPNFQGLDFLGTLEIS